MRRENRTTQKPITSLQCILFFYSRSHSVSRPMGLIQVNRAAPCPLASSSSPTQVVRGLVAPEMSAGEELRRSSRIQQLTRLKAPEKQVKSSLRNSNFWSGCRLFALNLGVQVCPNASHAATCPLSLDLLNAQIPEVSRRTIEAFLERGTAEVCIQIHKRYKRRRGSTYWKNRVSYHDHPVRTPGNVVELEDDLGACRYGQNSGGPNKSTPAECMRSPENV
jgi:hypothetical protein